MRDITTTDIAKFGNREKAMAAELLQVMTTKGLPEDFYNDEVTIMMNLNSGNVFLTNSEFQVAMMNGDALESWYSCPQCGHEGFKDSIDHHSMSDKDCQRWVKEILNQEVRI